MGRKSSAKAQASAASAGRPPSGPQQSPPRRLLALAGVALVAIVGVLLYSRSGPAPDAASQAVAAPQPQPAGEPENAKFGPHAQTSLPPLPFDAAIPVRPTAEVTTAYKFAAEHPEVLGYVPCYCGCERQGHRGNDDCFVRRRAPNGDVVEWEPHGMT